MQVLLSAPRFLEKMDDKKIIHYNLNMLWHLPNTIRAASWWWKIVTSIDTRALIGEDELHSSFEYAKNFYKKVFEQDEGLPDRQKEMFKLACEVDLSFAEHMAKQYELEEVVPHVFRYKEPYKEQIPVPHWVQYIFQKHIDPNIAR